MPESISIIVEYLGGPVLVILVLINFLGLIQLKRIGEKDKGKVQSEIEKLKNELTQTNQKLQVALDKSLHIHKVQFEKEFNIYEDIWQKLVEIKKATLSLRPRFDSVDPQESLEERKKKRMDSFSSSFTPFRDSIEKNRPFYAQDIYKLLNDLLKVTYNEAIDFQYSEKQDRQYWEEGKKNEEEILQKIEAICESIRNRFQGVEVS